MKAIYFISLVAVIMTSNLLAWAETHGDEDHMPTTLTSYIDLLLDDSDLSSKNILSKSLGYDMPQGLSLETNLVLNFDPNIYGDSIRFYTYKKRTNLGGSQSFMENTISHSSGNKSRHAIILNEVEFWPFIQGQIQNDFVYNARIVTYAPNGYLEMGQYSREWPGYSTLQPEIAFSWLNRETSMMVSILSGLDFENEDITGDYQSDVVRVDTTVAHFRPLLGGFLGLGVNGYYLKQINADNVSFSRLGSSKMKSGGIGPVMFYLHDIGKNELIFAAKWLPKVNVRNTSMESFVRLELTLIF